MQALTVDAFLLCKTFPCSFLPVIGFGLHCAVPCLSVPSLPG
ncbi:hypothetical protein SPONL_2231 [uncultured Candidatus Thioglobus sp.]|nr:hypothetical protein SPONL_2231 [uncultured Candidatus Thioglobus sp.]